MYMYHLMVIMLNIYLVIKITGGKKSTNSPWHVSFTCIQTGWFLVVVGMTSRTIVTQTTHVRLTRNAFLSFLVTLTYMYKGIHASMLLKYILLTFSNAVYIHKYRGEIHLHVHVGLHIIYHLAKTQTKT